MLSRAFLLPTTLSMLLLTNSPVVYCAECLPTTVSTFRDLYVIAGQSNAAGLANINDTPLIYSSATEFPRAMIYGIYGASPIIIDKDNATSYADVDWSAQASWGTAKPGYGSKDLRYYKQAINSSARPEELNNLFGPELVLADFLTSEPPFEAYLVKLAIGGTTLAPGDDNISGDWAPGSYLYNELLETIVDAYNSRRFELKLRIAGLFWMQGESDAFDATRSANYQSSLATFIDQFRQSVANMKCPTISPEFPIILGMVQENSILPFRERVRTAQERMKNVFSGIDTLNTDALSRIDKVHFSEVGQYDLGSRLFRMFNRNSSEHER